MIAREIQPPYGSGAGVRLGVCMLDTSVVVGIVRRHPPSLELLARLRGGGAGGAGAQEGAEARPGGRRVLPTLSAVVRYEAERGVRSPEGRVRLGALLDHAEVMPFTGGDATAAARIDRQLREAREPIGELDVLIAGAALARGVPLLTYNVRHFARVRGLAVWDAGAGGGAGTGA